MELRDYQQKAVEELRLGLQQGHRCQILCSPTGSGKTAMASHMIQSAAERGNPSLFVVDRTVLVDQAISHLQSFNLKVGRMQADNSFYQRDDQVVVATIQTLRSRFENNRLANLPNIKFGVIDECHILHQAHIELIERWNNLPFIGLSATPLREDLGKYFSNMVTSATIDELTKMGYLVPVKPFSPTGDKLKQLLCDVDLTAGDYVQSQLSKKLNTRELVGDIVSTYKRLADGKRALVFACDIAHSESIRDDFEAEGIACGHIDKSTSQEDRQELFNAYRSGEIKVLTSVNVLGIGFDMPIAEVGILARPTLSTALHIQQIGRVLRPCEGKDHALILDHAGNLARHGLPEHFMVPDLANRDRSTSHSKRDTEKMVSCSSCGFMMEVSQHICPNCGIERPGRENKVTFIDGELAEFGKAKSESFLSEMDFYLELKSVQEMRGYKPTYPATIFKNRFKRWPPFSWNQLESMPPSEETLRYVTSQQIRYRKRKRA